jgi:repressor LexA
MTTAHILTKKQAATLDFIRAFINQEGMPPTRKEISDGLGHSSPNGANDGLRVLAKHGYLTLLPRRSRGIRLNLEKCK